MKTISNIKDYKYNYLTGYCKHTYGNHHKQSGYTVCRSIIHMFARSSEAIAKAYCFTLGIYFLGENKGGENTSRLLCTVNIISQVLQKVKNYFNCGSIIAHKTNNDKSYKGE